MLFPLALLAKATLFTVYCLLVGRATQKLIKQAGNAPFAQEQNLFLTAFFYISTGMAVLTMILFALGMSSQLSLAATSLALSITLVGSLAYTAGSSGLAGPKEVRVSRQRDWARIAQYIFFSGLFISVVLVAICPPGHWDDTMYHLPYARHYLENHAILMNPYLRFPLFPQNGDLLFSLGLMYGTETDAQVLATLPLFVIALGLFGACQVFIRSASASYVALLLFFALGPVKEALGYAYVDNILALYAWGATLALALWLSNRHDSSRWLITCGLLAGAAAGTKLFGAVLVVLIGLYLLVAVRKLRATVVYAVTTVLFGIWWYLRSFLISGDPVHPAGGNVFGHFLWNAADLLSQQQEQSTHGVEKGLLHIFGALQSAHLLLLVPALFVFIQPAARRRPVSFLYIILLAYLIFWLYVTQVSRYVAPVLATGAFLSVLFIYQAGFGSSLRQCSTGVVARWPRLVASMMVVIGGFTMVYLGAKAAASQLANWDATLKARAGYEIMTAANALVPQYGDKLLQVGYENAIYFFKGTAIGDWFGPGRYSSMLSCEAQCQIVPAAQMIQLMNGFGAQMLAVNSKRFQFDPRPYMELFKIEKQSGDGYLLALKMQAVESPK